MIAAFMLEFTCKQGFKKFVGNKSKGRILKWVLKENKAHQFFQKTNISYPDMHMCICVSGGKKCLFFGKFGVLCFLLASVLRFSLLLYCRQIRLCIVTMLIGVFTKVKVQLSSGPFWKGSHSRTCAYQGVRNVSFLKKFVYVLTGWPQVIFKI